MVLDHVPEIEISGDEYSRLETARKVLSNALAIEEKYEIVVANFLELEMQLLHAAATDTVRTTLSYAEFFELRSVLNIRLVNLLSSVRLYLDQLPQHVGDCIPENTNARYLVKAQCSREYDEHFEYRFMEALRNHVQHRGIPIHLIRQDARWTSIGDGGLLEFTVDIAAQRSYLEEDEKFKKAVLDEISADVDLKAASRCYIESVSAINELARESIAESVKCARRTIEAARERYAEVWADSLVGIAAVAVNNERQVSSVPLLLDWDDVRIELQRRNTQLKNLRKRYVTGKVRNDTR